MVESVTTCLHTGPKQHYRSTQGTIQSLYIRAKMNIRNESERIPFMTNKCLNFLSVFSIKLLA